MYFNAHACLAAYMNILSRNLSAIHASLVKPWRVTLRQLNQSAYDIADVGGF